MKNNYKQLYKKIIYKVKGENMAYILNCKSCGSKLLTYEIYERKYGSPLCACKKCGCEYIDPRVQELAVVGMPEKEFKISNCIILFVIGLLIAWRGCYLFSSYQLGVVEEIQWLMPVVILLLGIALIVGSIVEMIRIKTGSKQKKFQQLLVQSQARMADQEYVAKLEHLGYLVPQPREE